ncbi:hypothetical protein BDV96DRAFT_144971 [Lophiotrema nucula]|uniref:Uncharacterized protein n=1 Tax=Lophiotrema nucula TaxID=690887 RepID=A0A6A5Z186_9PLEO|nr:hypothetical protein BDV96DRAFT_144971 [Lophiotrema nucula]
MSESNAQERTIAFLSLKHEPYFDEMYLNLVADLNQDAMVDRLASHSGAIAYLSHCTPDVVLVTDAGVAGEHNKDVLDLLKNYTFHGGTTVFGCTFSSHIRPPVADALFALFDKPWKFGSYTREDTRLRKSSALEKHWKENQSRKPASNNPFYKPPVRDLKQEYSQKAVFLSGVTKGDSVYYPVNESQGAAAAVWAKCENGRIGYVGDVNGEEGSRNVVLAMCGL